MGRPNSCVLSLVITSAILFSNISVADMDQHYKNSISHTNEMVDKYPAKEIVRRLMERPLNKVSFFSSTEFGVHGMERPFIHYNQDTEASDKAFQLLSRAGVDSLRSSEAAWHRLADKNNNLTQFSDLDYQLTEAKKYGMSNLFVVGYPPGKFSVSGNKLSAVNPKYYPQYKAYYSTLLNHFKNKNVEYLELGNEVDAGHVWWIKSTPRQYVTEMCLLHDILATENSKIKTVAFSSTFSRNDVSRPGEGRDFLNKSVSYGIDRCSDAYSLHHFSMASSVSFPDFMHEFLRENKIDKPLLDTEQLDTSTLDKSKTQPYEIIKIYTRAFFMYNLHRVDYYMAKDIQIGSKFYTMGLFDIHFNPKPRLLAYAAAVDALKNRKLIEIQSPSANIESYLLANPTGSKYKYTIVMWSNGKKSTVKGLKGKGDIEKWDLTTTHFDTLPGSMDVGTEPVIIYLDEKPAWSTADKVSVLSVYKNNKAKSEIPLP